MRATARWSAAALLVALAGTSQARELELGGFGGIHLFSKHNELGNQDRDPSGTTPKNGGAFGVRLGVQLWSRLFLEGELAIMPTEARAGGTDVDVFALRAHFLYELSHGRLRPFVLLGWGFMASSSSNERVIQEDVDPAFHGGAGLKYDVRANWGVRFDARVLLPPSNQSHNGITTDFEGLVGIYGRFGRALAAAPVVVAPLPPADSDGDGIADDHDKCPSEAEDRDGFQDADGCADLDNDADGVADAGDKCPDAAGPAENHGCPDADQDGDGVVDRLDKCPAQAGVPDNQGCPDTDQDGDGIVDRLDKCPAEAETVNGYQDQDGCPDQPPAAMQQFTGAIKGITFKNGSAEIDKKSLPLLDQAAAVLVQYPDVSLEISGHTDDRGDHAKNLALSAQRAEAVKAYLVSRQIAASRLSAVGYGPDKPATSNQTAKGRAQNRRIEFQLAGQK